MRPVIFLLLLTTFFQCQRPADSLIVGGAWKTDSVYSYYNGFASTKYDFEEEPVRSYSPDGKLVMTRGPESRTFSYTIKDNDSLFHQGTDYRLIEKFRILKINNSQMVLRKELAPVFAGAGQTRYQLIYCSRDAK